MSIVQDGLVVVATFDPPLDAGTYALSWRVRSDDTHFINGTLAFTVDVPVATTAAPLSESAPPTTDAPAAVVVDVAEPRGSDEVVAAPAT